MEDREELWTLATASRMGKSSLWAPKIPVSFSPNRSASSKKLGSPMSLCVILAIPHLPLLYRETEYVCSVLGNLIRGTG